LQNRQHTSNNPSKHRILVVDDEQDITFTFQAALEDNGFTVTTFNNPLLALSYFTANAYDLLLLDIRMPQMGGFEFYRKIRKIDKNIMVYFMTAFEQYYEEFEKASPTLISAYFIRKPVNIHHLVEELTSKLSKSSSTSSSSSHDQHP
jgi:DNA-binding response OmpR family regulator